MSARGGTTPVDQPDGWELDFVDHVAAFADVSGVPPSVLRVFGWLVVCEPPEQSVDDLRTALGLSAGAISMAMSTLARIGIVERISRPGERRHFYRLHPQAWERMNRIRLESLTDGRAAIERALDLAPSPNPRLERMRDLYAH
ncbi:MAG TPA: MarR family transcriptional regulator, partial [Actinomycetota bacterium]